MNSVGVEVAPDFMFWSSRKHRLGWYLEPSYEYNLGLAMNTRSALPAGF
jgi:hypothetical protein